MASDPALRRVRPPGPFPPQGREPRGTVDLGIRQRDLLYTRHFLTGAVRSVLANRLSAIAREGRLALATTLPALLLDTWPLGALIDDARERWTEAPDGQALAVLSRAAEVIAQAVGWPQTIDRRWPMPDPDWINDNAGDQPSVVVGRGARDGAPAMATFLRCALGAPEPQPLPPLLHAYGDELCDRLDELLTRIAADEAVAVCFDTPVPDDAEAQAAYEQLLDAAPQQGPYRRYGQAGLLVDNLIEWESLLSQAPAGTPGPSLRRTCDALVLPTHGKKGGVELVGCVVWNAPHRPLLVQPGAVQLLDALDEDDHSIEAIARRVSAKPDVVERWLTQLVAAGAATAED